MQTISVRALFTEKAPRMAARIPSPCYRLLERLAHTRELNRYVQHCSSLSPRRALTAAMRRLRLRYRVQSTSERSATHGSAGPAAALPQDSRITVVANHPLGGADALVLLDLLMRRYGQVHVPANDLVHVIGPLAPFFVPVNKHGCNRTNSRRLNALFASDAPALVFPAGRTGRPAAGRLLDRRIVDFPWTKTFVTRSRRNGRTIVPVYIDGRNSLRFYLVAWLRTRLAIKANLEMLLLVDELARCRGTTLDLVVGSPIDAALLDPGRGDHLWAADFRAYVRALGDGRREDFFTWLGERYGEHGHDHGQQNVLEVRSWEMRS